MESDESRRISASTAHRAGDAPTAENVSDAVVAILKDITIALTPIIGQGGVSALYRRSLYLCSARHITLLSLNDNPEKGYAGLRYLLAQQSSDTATMYGNDLLTTFNELLASFIGSSLSECLLRSVWENSFSGTSPQDTSS